MTQVTLTLNINEEELRNIRNSLTALQGKDVLNASEAEAVEGLLTLTDTIKDAVDKGTPNDTVCPVCQSDDIQGGHIEVESGEAYQRCTCHCGASWNNTYSFKGSSEIQEG